MSKSTLKLVITAGGLAILIVVATVYVFIGSLIASQPSDTSEATTDAKDEVQIEKQMEPKDKEEPDYKAAYINYTRENKEYFEAGIVLFDLNDDDIPELFSLNYDAGENGETLYYHEYRDGKVIAPSQYSIKTYIDFDDLLKPKTFYSDVSGFHGIYENKKTGKKAFINSMARPDGEDIFDIITYDGDKLVLLDEGVKAIEDDSRRLYEKRDAVMNEYRLSEDKIYSRVAIRGILNADYDVEALIEEFRQGNESVEYGEAADGEFFCYIRNIDEDKNELELIPAAEVVYEDYIRAVENDDFYIINGEAMSIQYCEDDDMTYLYQMPHYEYYFEEPAKDHPVSVLEGYMDITPVKVKADKSLKIRYGVVTHNENGTPAGYETLERKTSYTMSEYLPHFAEYNMHSYYKATVKDGELVYLDVMYHP